MCGLLRGCCFVLGGGTKSRVVTTIRDFEFYGIWMRLGGEFSSNHLCVYSILHIEVVVSRQSSSKVKREEIWRNNAANVVLIILIGDTKL